MKPYRPECYCPPNKVVKIICSDFTDRSGNKMIIETALYLDKKGNEKEQVLRVHHLLEGSNDVPSH